MEPNVQRSIGSAGVQHGSYSLVFTIIPVLLALVLHWGGPGAAGTETMLTESMLGIDTTDIQQSFFTEIFLYEHEQSCRCVVVCVGECVCVIVWLRVNAEYPGGVDHPRKRTLKMYFLCFFYAHGFVLLFRCVNLSSILSEDIHQNRSLNWQAVD